MARTKGPLFALQASGTVGGVVTHTSWKGRTYAKTNRIPTNPSTAAMVSVRAGMAFLTQHWASVPAPHQATWEAPATAEKISPFNAYVSHNLNRASNFLTPVSQYPDPAPSAVVPIVAWTATAAVRSIILNFTLIGPGTIAGVQIFRSLSTGFTPGRQNLIHYLPAPTGGGHEWRDTPLTADTYYYRARPFNNSGNNNLNALEKNAIVA